MERINETNLSDLERLSEASWTDELNECANTDDLEADYSKMALERRVVAIEVSIGEIDKRVNDSLGAFKRMMQEGFHEFTEAAKQGVTASIART